MRRIFVTFFLAASCYGASILQPQKQPGSDDVSWTAQSAPHLMNLFGSMGHYVKRDAPVELQAATRFRELHPELAQPKGPNKLERRKESPVVPKSCEIDGRGKECVELPPPDSPPPSFDVGRGRETPRPPRFKPYPPTHPDPRMGAQPMPPAVTEPRTPTRRPTFKPPGYTEPRGKPTGNPRGRPMRARLERPRREPPTPPSSSRPPKKGARGTKQMTPAVGGMSMITYPGLHPPSDGMTGGKMREIVYGGLQPPGAMTVTTRKPLMRGERRVSPIPYGYYMRPYGSGKMPSSSGRGG